MASAADLVYQDIIDKLEALSPTSSVSRELFKFNKRPLTLSPDQSPAMTRSFTLYIDEFGEDTEPTDINERWCTVSYTLEVAYSTDYELDDLMKMIAKDRHDICKELRNDTSATIGLNGRWREGADEIDRGSTTTWYLRQRWDCDINESES